MLVNIKVNYGTLLLDIDSIDAMYFDTISNKLYVYRKGQSDVFSCYMDKLNTDEAIKQINKVINNEPKSNLE